MNNFGQQARFQAMAVVHGQLQDPGAPQHPLVIMDASVDKRKRRKRESQLDVLSLPSPLPGGVPQKEEKSDWAPSNKTGPAMLLLPSLPSLDQWNAVISATKPVITFTGTAAARNAGPLIGLVDIGISEDAYLFRTALPGVRKEEGMCVPRLLRSPLTLIIKLSSVYWLRRLCNNRSYM